MDELERAEMSTCVACGAEISIERERGYALGGATALCFACAMDRGGVYDETRERWTTPPDVARTRDT
jgi:hypothetical protein